MIFKDAALYADYPFYCQLFIEPIWDGKGVFCLVTPIIDSNVYYRGNYASHRNEERHTF